MLKRVIVVWNAWIGFSVCSPASGTDIRSIGTDIHLLSENDLYGVVLSSSRGNRLMIIYREPLG